MQWRRLLIWYFSSDYHIHVVTCYTKLTYKHLSRLSHIWKCLKNYITCNLFQWPAEVEEKSDSHVMTGNACTVSLSNQIYTIMAKTMTAALQQQETAENEKNINKRSIMKRNEARKKKRRRRKEQKCILNAAYGNHATHVLPTLFSVSLFCARENVSLYSWKSEARSWLYLLSDTQYVFVSLAFRGSLHCDSLCMRDIVCNEMQRNDYLIC